METNKQISIEDIELDLIAPWKHVLSQFTVLRKSRFLRWFVYGSAIGVLSGLAAALFFYVLEWGAFFFLDYLAGYDFPLPAGEHLASSIPGKHVLYWLLVLLPAFGGLLSGLIVTFSAPEAEGEGTDAYIEAFHRQGFIRPRVPLVKGMASIAILATGGSAGREGPIAQIGAGLGSMLGRLMKLDVRERRLMLLAGCAGGLSAIFRAPLGGAFMAAEILYREDLETEGLILSVISSLVSYEIFTAIFGRQPIFAFPRIEFPDPLELLFYASIGLVCVPFGFLFTKMLSGLKTGLFEKLPIRREWLPAVGGLLVGLVALWHKEILGGGYGTMQRALLGELPVAFLFTLAFLKIATTSFTLSSGGSGGIFAPALFIGAVLGGAVGRLAHTWCPSIVGSPGAFALVGMATFLACVAKAPLGALFMVSEMTGSYDLLVPIMLSSVLAILLTQRWSIFQNQVENKFHSPAHQSDRLVYMLKGLAVKDVYRPDSPATVLPEDMTFTQLRRVATSTNESVFPVVDNDSRLTGILSLLEIRAALSKKSVWEMLSPRDLLLPPISVAPDESLSAALVKFLETGFTRIPIVDQRKGLIGILGLEDLLTRYQQELQKSIRGETGAEEGSAEQKAPL
ncbi:MAG: chloride channel protein [Syntrophobacteraceae bacterium]|nr:chloride channel protein [Syntrophobacteraceae bacterium]